ncbi:C39 family peptidase [Clostridium sp. MD294]|uniref:C39 family peptidase n=1 Tax=Clostridium sp. MD294 TaxID=97138 RepID=UPI0002CAAED8|nr:C39 family peptidase [Clostridium sp. MD294]NDO45730.1 murein hydrolase [Clostridium sp. MD294]USF30616.1 hypothetical protein C820_002059 [Clostridium sp. MD294]
MRLEIILQIFLFSSIFLILVAYYNRTVTIPNDKIWNIAKFYYVKKSTLISILSVFIFLSFSLQQQEIVTESKTVQWIAEQAANQATAKELTRGITYYTAKSEVVYYNQEDIRWANEKYGKTDLISVTGCGPTCLAMVVSTLTDITINPKQMADWSYQNGYCAEGSGSYHTLIENAAKTFGLQVEQATVLEGQKIVDALSDNKLVIALMGKGTFTSSGHFIVLKGITEQGNVLVADPKSKKNTRKTFPLGLILSEAKGSADSLGPFWIIY